LLTSIGIGQALITALNEKGIPTPLAATHLRAPMSRIGVLTSEEIQQIVSASTIAAKYNEIIDRESAFEILNSKLKATEEQEEIKQVTKKSTKEEKSTIEKLSENTMVRQVGRTVMKEVARGLLGVLGLGGKKKGGWF
jgi:hypothetical protein